MQLSGTRSRLHGLIAVVAVAASAAVLTLSVAGAAVASSGPVTEPPPGVPIVSAADQLAHELGELGRTAYADSFAGVTVDESSARVTLYTTDPRAGRELAATAAGRVDAGVRSRAGVDVRVARYTRAELIKALGRLKGEARDMARSGVEVGSIALRNDGSGLVAATNRPALAKTMAGQAAGGPPVTFEREARTSDVSRYQDVPPYAGGIHLGAGGPSLCSSAFGIHTGSGNLLVSAQHCFLWHYLDVYTGGGARYIGHVTAMNDLSDAAGISTRTWSGVFTADDQHTHYGGAAWSYAGQEVCQSGVASNHNCGIRLNTSYLQWQGSNGVWHGGVEGCSPIGASSVRRGDSGGPVYVWYGDGRIQSRGIVSQGRDTDGDAEFECLRFTETMRLLNVWGASLLVR